MNPVRSRDRGEWKNLMKQKSNVIDITHANPIV